MPMVCTHGMPRRVAAFVSFFAIGHAMQSFHVKLDVAHRDSGAGASQGGNHTQAGKKRHALKLDVSHNDSGAGASQGGNHTQAGKQRHVLKLDVSHNDSGAGASQIGKHTHAGKHRHVSPGLLEDAKDELHVQHLADESPLIRWMSREGFFGVSSVALMSKAWMAAFSQSFCVVGVAELFDKTWFVALLYAISLGRRVAFVGSYVALLLHVAIAAALGFGFSQLFKVSTLHFVTTAVFAIFAVLYFCEWFRADPEADALADRADETRDELGEEDAAALPKTSGKVSDALINKLAWRCFVAVFIAEWGDRTQIAMITLHASLPVLPVCIGSAAAFFLLTLSAVIVATLLDGMKLSERLVLGMSASSFFVFALLAFRDGWEAREAELTLMHRDV